MQSNEIPTVEQTRARFAGDLYATEVTGIFIEKAEKNYALCTLELEPRHKNAEGGVMGGAIFTLADLTFAVAANTGSPVTVSLTGQINYLSGVKGTRLIAEAVCKKSGRGTCVFNVDIRDELGTDVAQVVFTGYRKG